MNITASVMLDAFGQVQESFAGSTFFGLLAASEMFQLLVSIFFEGTGQFGIEMCTVSAFQAGLQDVRQLSPSQDLKSFFNLTFGGATCPPFDGKSVDTYNDIIARFGTGFVSKGTIGGVARFVYASESTVFNSLEDAAVEANARASFFNIVAAAGGASGHETVATSFNQTLSYSAASTFGGTLSPFSVGGKQWAEWEQSVFERPTVVQSQMLNLSSLVSTYSPTCGAGLARAEDNYYWHAFLQSVALPTLKSARSYIQQPCFQTLCYVPAYNASCQGLVLTSRVDELSKQAAALLATPVVSRLEAALFGVAYVALLGALPKHPWKYVHYALPQINWPGTDIHWPMGFGLSQVANSYFISYNLTAPPSNPAVFTDVEILVTSGPQNVSFLLYDSAKALQEVHLARFSCPVATEMDLGEQWLCLIASQTVFTSVFQNTSGWYVNNFAPPGVPLDVDVICLSGPLPNLPPTVVQYTVSQMAPSTTFSPHAFCVANYFNCGMEFAWDGNVTWTMTYRFPSKECQAFPDMYITCL